MSAPTAIGPTVAANARQLVERIAAVVTPISVVTGLLAYVGWVYTNSFYGYFGVPRGVLNLSVPDYVFDSDDVILGAMIWLLAVGVVMVAVDRLLQVGISQLTPVQAGRVRQGIAVVGLLLTITAGAYALGVGSEWNIPPLLGAASLAVGVLTAVRFRIVGGIPALTLRWSRLLAIAAVAATMAVALFWAATLYAQQVGQDDAAAAAASDSRRPVVTVFSTTYLDLPGSRVHAFRLPSPAGGWSYRYTGPLLLTYTNGRWLLLTGINGVGYRSTVAVLRDTDSIRVDTQTPAGP